MEVKFETLLPINATWVIITQHPFRHLCKMNTTETTLSGPTVWSAFEKISFRFLFCLFLLIIAFVNNGAFPYWSVIFHYPIEGMQMLALWVAKHVLHITQEIYTGPTGSGDTTFDYALLLTLTLLSTIGTITWSLLNRKSTHYTTLYYWLTVAVRFYVGLMLINYGMIKVFKLQFPAPSIGRLMQPYGESSPMGLAWTFLGFSTGYNLFMGIAELMAGLLLFRRTMTLGAIITLMTTANVMAVNYFYDVPVKLVSTTLTVMTLFLLMHDAKKMFTFFFTSQPVSLTVIQAPVYKKKFIRIAGLSFKFLLLGYVLIYGCVMGTKSLKEYGDHAVRPKFYGAYNVDSFVLNNDTLPAGKKDSLAWKQLIISAYEGYARIITRNDSAQRYTYTYDTLKHAMNFALSSDSTVKYEFTYERKRPSLFLKGMIRQDSVRIHFTQMDERDKKKFRLINRGFHWVNEVPYNR
jgi:hypothetical protein